MRNRYIQAPYLSPGFGDWGYRGVCPRSGCAAWSEEVLWGEPKDLMQEKSEDWYVLYEKR